MHRPGLFAQAAAIALGAGGVAAVAAEEDADVQLVLLALERGEEALDAGEVVVAIENFLALAGGQLGPGTVGVDLFATGEAADGSPELTAAGYVVADRLKRKEIIGVIPVDAIYTPVRRVTYVVEHTRVEQMTNYDKLILEVETNGAVTPQEAVVHASRRLGELIGLFEELMEPLPGGDRVTEPASGPRVDADRPIEQLDLSVRALNCLKREGIHTLGELLECTMEDLMDIRNFGEKSVEEVAAKLEEMGLNLKEKEV